MLFLLYRYLRFELYSRRPDSHGFNKLYCAIAKVVSYDIPVSPVLVTGVVYRCGTVAGSDVSLPVSSTTTDFSDTRIQIWNVNRVVDF
jgi:hypothetical protein